MERVRYFLKGRDIYVVNHPGENNFMKEMRKLALG